MPLFSSAQVNKINEIAARSKESSQPAKVISTRSINDDLDRISKQVQKYFEDSPAQLITEEYQLHDYIDKCIEAGYCGIDTETTGLDRIHDYIVGASLYAPGDVEVYMPCRHRIPIFETPYKNQISYEVLSKEFQRLVDHRVKLIFANADFDLAMIYKDLKVDMTSAFYYDVILAWRCLKENEKDNSLKGLYAKYVMKGQVDPKKFSDFFSPTLFPYCQPNVAKLYAANDAKITYDLFRWQLPYVTKSSEKCKSHHLEKIADLVWNIEFPMVKVCAMLHRRGIYLDKTITSTLHGRYTSQYNEEAKKLAEMVQELIDTKDSLINKKRPFRTGSDFNANSPTHVKYLVVNLLGKDTKSTDKKVLQEMHLPVTDQVLKVRGVTKILSTYVDKLPNATASDGRVHPSFKSVGADTGRMSSDSPNAQNIPSHATDIRHMFRATPEIEEEVTLQDNTLQVFYQDCIKVSDNEYVKADILESGSVIECGVISSRSERNSEGKITFDISKNSDIVHILHCNYVMMSSDFSQQEPKLTAFCSNESKMINNFIQGRDIYSTISSIAFNLPYEDCLEHVLDENGNKTEEVNPEGKARRGIGKVLVLGLNYGMSPSSIGEMIFKDEDNLSEEEKSKKAQQIVDAVMTGFPELRDAIEKAKLQASTLGYTETILGRRRHHPNMQLPRFAFEPKKGYTNPDIDPLDPESMKNKDQIPKRVIKQLEKEFNSYKYFSQIVKRTKQLDEMNIRVINNTKKITEASRQVWNAIIQGSAADLTKMAMLKLEHDPEWIAIGGRFLIPVHDELICEVPYENREKGAEVLARCMCDAGSFLPFKLTCDVETTFRWYGIAVEDILEKEKPTSLENLSESNIEWLQCMLVENEYLLPVYKDADGKKPKGIAAKGVNGKWSDEMAAAIEDYKKKYSVSDENFLNHIEAKVFRGILM